MKTAGISIATLVVGSGAGAASAGGPLAGVIAAVVTAAAAQTAWTLRGFSDAGDCKHIWHWYEATQNKVYASTTPLSNEVPIRYYTTLAGECTECGDIMTKEVKGEVKLPS